jgi:hypothetical protein
MKVMQAFINCDLPGQRQIEYDTGSGFTAATISGWLPFKDYVAALSAELPNSWSMAYDTSLDRVVVTAGTGTLALRFESQSMADSLGNTSTTTGTMTTTTRLNTNPQGAIPIQHLHIANPVAGNKPTLRGFRHGRAHATAFGAAVNYRVTVRFDSSDLDRVQSGPLCTGKLRFGDYTASAVYGADNLGGYLDGFMQQQNNLFFENEESEIGCTSELTIIAPDAAHDNDEAVSDAFWGHIVRGYSLNYFCTIEGVQYRFVEHDVGFSSGDYTDSFTLIVDDSQKAHYKIDRFKGLAAASGVTIGVLDPENELGLFTRASVQIPIDSAVAYDDTSITLASDSTNFSTSGVVYLGKEALQFSGNTGPSGTPANTLQNITRPFGEGYDYGTKTTEKFRTVTNKKRVWNGCEVDLRAMLLDPYGRAVGTTYADSYQRKVFSGELDGVPGYDSGVWVMQTRDLLRRLTRKIGQGAIGRTAPRADEQQLLGNQPASESSSIYVRTSGSELLVLKVVGNAGQQQIETIEYELTLSTLGLPTFHTLFEGIEAIIQTIKGLQLTAGAGTNGYVHEQCTILHFADGYTLNTDGSVMLGFALGGKSGADYDITNIEISVKKGYPAPHWLQEGIELYNGHSDGSGLTELIKKTIPALTGQSLSVLVIKQPPNSAATLGSWESEGFALLEGDNDFAELIKYTSISTSGIPNRIALVGCTRNILGEPVNVFKSDREIKQALRQGTNAEALSASLGSLACQVLESSGNSQERGGFDDFPAGFGYALKASKHVMDNPDTLGKPELCISSALNFQADMILTGGVSFENYFGGTAAAMGFCFSWVRYGTDLRIGCVSTFPGGSEEEFTLTDADLVAGSSVEIVKVAAGPNEVIVEQAESPTVKSKSQYTYRVIEDMLSRGSVSQKVSLYGLTESEFFVFARGLAVSLVNNSSSDVAYRMKVRPGRDYLAGQNIRVDITHPSVFDWKNNQTGLQDTARITEVQRSLSTGECTLTMMTSATSFFPALCPVAVVTAYDGTASDGIITVTDASIFKVNDVLRAYNPGMTFSDEKSVLAVDTSTNQITISGLLGFVPSVNYTCCTYPVDTNASISNRQAAHAHISDGGSYV